MKENTKKINAFLKRNLKWIILFICLIAFIELTEDVFSQEIMKADSIGYQIIEKYLISDYVTPIAKIITNLGGATCLISITVILMIAVKNKKIGLFIMLNLILQSLLNVLLKNILQRPRPTEYRIIDESGYSFPSGHSMASMAFYGFLIYLIYKNIKNKKIKYIAISMLSILIVAIGISRIYLGVHYTSDVIAGFLVSIFYLILYTSIISTFLKPREEEGNG